MHVRFSTSIGLPVVDERMEFVFGTLTGVLIHPDSGKIEGFFVGIPRMLRKEIVFLSSVDILRWGARVTVRDGDVLAPPEEFFRLAALFAEKRTVLGQKIRTESGRMIGVCADIQFDTGGMRLEWLFPRRFFQWRLGIPARDIVRVTEEAIIVRDSQIPIREKREGAPSILNVIPDIAETIPRPTCDA